MKTLTLDYNNPVVIEDLNHTLSHNHISATLRILRTTPTTRVELDVDDHVDIIHILKICKANAVLGPRSK